MAALSTLLDSLIDYAGLFPPARLPMAEAVRAYAAYLHSPYASALGRFVVPLARLDEFEGEFARLAAQASPGWRLSVLAGPDPAADGAVIDAFNSRQAHARIISVETKPASADDITRAVGSFPPTLEVWVEIPGKGDPAAFAATVKATGRGAKLRTGGVTADAFPPPAEIARFMTSCHAAGVVFKATAGLHHPLRGDYPLTGEPGSPRATMSGFLNLFLAAALVKSGDGDECASLGGADVIALLEDTDAGNFSAAPDAVGWRDHRFTNAQFAATRQDLCRSFGSCSFTEPITGLRALGWL